LTKLGYTLSGEEFDAPTLIAQAERAERAGFAFASISDHFHPWIDAQGESPFVWGALGAISQRTERMSHPLCWLPSPGRARSSLPQRRAMA
jgi:alkanesulfonate monooxygenase SsuD/methylene tetrahydromethanopterin reductase-like flavin-dependent oxidoreductase (luciferase family)